MRNLPHRAFQRRPLLWGAPPTDGEGAGSVIAPPSTVTVSGGGSGPASESGTISSVSFSYSNLLGSINTAFPVAVRVAVQPFVTAVGVVSVILSTSVKNASSDGIAAFFVAKDLGANLSVDTNSNLYVEHMVIAGLSHSMRSGVVFADDVALKIGSNEGIALYVSSAGTGANGNLLVATVTIRYFSLT